MTEPKLFMDTVKNAYILLRLHNLDNGRKQCNIVHVLSNGTDNGSIAVTLNDLTPQWQCFVPAHARLVMSRWGMGMTQMVVSDVSMLQNSDYSYLKYKAHTNL
jgi:hypothetical protein